jgi:hypothetical protein
MGCFTERASPNGASPPDGSGYPVQGFMSADERRDAVAVAVAVDVSMRGR